MAFGRHCRQDRSRRYAVAPAAEERTGRKARDDLRSSGQGRLGKIAGLDNALLNGVRQPRLVPTERYGRVGVAEALQKCWVAEFADIAFAIHMAPDLSDRHRLGYENQD